MLALPSLEGASPAHASLLVRNILSCSHMSAGPVRHNLAVPLDSVCCLCRVCMTNIAWKVFDVCLRVQMFLEYRCPGGVRVFGLQFNNLMDTLQVFASSGHELVLKYPNANMQLECQ